MRSYLQGCGCPSSQQTTPEKTLLNTNEGFPIAASMNPYPLDVASPCNLAPHRGHVQLGQNCIKQGAASDWILTSGSCDPPHPYYMSKQSTSPEEMIFLLGTQLSSQDGGCFVQRTVTHSKVCGHAWVVAHIQRSKDNQQESFLSLYLVRSGLEFRSSGLAASTSVHCTIPPAPLHRFFLRNVFVYVYRYVTCMYICTPQVCSILASQKRVLYPLELLLMSCCVWVLRIFCKSNKCS